MELAAYLLKGWRKFEADKWGNIHYIFAAHFILQHNTRALFDNSRKWREHGAPLLNNIQRLQRIRSALFTVEDEKQREMVARVVSSRIKEERSKLRSATLEHHLFTKTRKKLVRSFTILPHSSFSIPHIHFDSHGFRLLLQWAGSNDANIPNTFSTSSSLGWPWLDHLDLTTLNLGMPGQYDKRGFGSHISTDGVSCSITLFQPVSKAQKASPHRFKPKMQLHKGPLNNVDGLTDWKSRPLYAIDMGIKDFIVCVPHRDNPEKRYDEERQKRRRNKRRRYRTRKRKKKRGALTTTTTHQARTSSTDKKVVAKAKRREIRQRKRRRGERDIRNFLEELKSSQGGQDESSERETPKVKWKRDYRKERKRRRQVFEGNRELREMATYSSRQYLFDIKRTQHMRKMRAWKQRRDNGVSINDIEGEMPPHKVGTVEEYFRYVDYILQHGEALLSFYGSRRFAWMRFDGFIARKSALERLCNKITKGNTKAIVAVGADGNTRISPVPSKAFVRLLSHKCTVIMVDEFRTSRMLRDSATELKGQKGDRKSRVLHYYNDGKRHIVNRDVNAALNIMDVLVGKLKGDPRPSQLCRKKGANTPHGEYTRRMFIRSNIPMEMSGTPNAPSDHQGTLTSTSTPSTSNNNMATVQTDTLLSGKDSHNAMAGDDVEMTGLETTTGNKRPRHHQGEDNLPPAKHQRTK